MKSRPRFGVVGYGAIGRVLVMELAKASDGICLPLLVKPKYLETVSAEAPKGVVVVDSLEDFLAHAPETVIESAGASAVEDIAVGVLETKADLVLASASALTDDDLYRRIAYAARDNGRQAVVASGALGSLDVLAAMAAAGLESVTYRGVKPPAAWRGTCGAR